MAAVLGAWRASGANGAQPIALPSGDDESFPDRFLGGGEAADNPLAAVDVPMKVLITIFALSISGSIVLSLIFMVRTLSHPLSPMTRY